MRKMTAQEVERRLGMQYAQVLQNNAQHALAYRDCEEDINNSLNLLQHYNKVNLIVKNRLAGNRSAGVFS